MSSCQKDRELLKKARELRKLLDGAATAKEYQDILKHNSETTKQILQILQDTDDEQ